LRAALSDGWDVESITAEGFEVKRQFMNEMAQAWLAVVRRM